MHQPLRVVVFGNGFASRVQLPALRAIGANQVVGIAGRSLERARQTAQRYGIERATSDYRELLELEPDLVLVTTPVDLHAPMVRDALDSGAAILCEKPFTLDAAEAEELCRAARGRLALIDHQLRWNPLRHELARLVNEGELGDVWHVRVHAHWGAPLHRTRPHSWWYEAQRGGGILGAGASHLIDGLRVLLGEVHSVRARLETYVLEREGPQGPVRGSADEQASLWLRFANGTRATLETDLVFPHGRFLTLEVAGSAGFARLEDEEHLFFAANGEELSEIVLPALDVPDSPELAAYGAFGRFEPLFLRDVLAALRRGERELAGAASFEDGLACMRVLDAARRSDAEERWSECN